MSYAASIQSTTGTIATYARKFASKPNIEILVDDHSHGKAYTTFDTITGRVNITSPNAARFDEIKITLEGTTKTYVDNTNPQSTQSRTTATHNFLKLIMPIRETDYPQPRVAEAGRTYTFPFHFVIPEQLLPHACVHEYIEDHVHQAHLQLPPSLGERDVSIQDDLTPDMSKIQYCIKTKVIKNQDQDANKIVLAEGLRKLRVLPAVAEAPPMSLGHEYEDYVLSKTKSLRRGMFSGKLGRITVSAAQTGALILPPPSSATTSATTMATLNVRFDPHGASSLPPRLGGLITKIKSTTFFAARPRHALPSRVNSTIGWESVRGVYDHSVPLSSRCVGSVAWRKHELMPGTERRNSDSSTCSSDCSDTSDIPVAKDGAGYYTATILVPITLPSSKTWVPTFHTCVTSRVYTIELSLTIHTPGAGVPASTVTLRLPVQIAAMGNQTERAPMTAAEAAAELEDADNFLRPRVIEVPREEHIGNSVLATGTSSELPPSYEEPAWPPRPVVEPGRC